MEGGLHSIYETKFEQNHKMLMQEVPLVEEIEQ